jgi:thiamine-phosphate pyrophosphorylase
MVLYYITDRMQFPGREPGRRERLLEKISEAARIGIDFVQLREKDLPARDMESLAREAVKRVRGFSSKTRVLINSRTDIALAAGADGVHLRSKDVCPKDVRNIWRESKGAREPVIAVSCHTAAEVAAAEAAGADFVVFSPVFEKRSSPAAQIAGVELLRSVCRCKIPVLALGGVTPENADLCVKAGANGIAGKRLFQEGNLAASVARFRHSL